MKNFRLQFVAFAVLLGVMFTPFCGCGASPYDVQRDAIRLAATTTSEASTIVVRLGEDTARRLCPESLARPEFLECAHRALVPLRPLSTAVDAVISALTAWLSAIDIAELAQDPSEDGALRAAKRAAAALVRAYTDLVDLLRPYEVTIPSLPEVIITIARGLEVE